MRAEREAALVPKLIEARGFLRHSAWTAGLGGMQGIATERREMAEAVTQAIEFIKEVRDGSSSPGIPLADTAPDACKSIDASSGAVFSS